MSLRPSERAEVRRSRYKVAVDAEDGGRRREDNMVEIHKNRREESLLKKRRNDLPPSIVAAAPQMAHSSALQQKVCSASVSKELNAKHKKVIPSMARMQQSMDAIIAPAIAMKLLWAAVIGNHDQEGTLSR